MLYKSAAFAVVAASAASAQYVTGALGDAPVTSGNSQAIVYSAVIMSANIQLANLNFTGTANGTGVRVQGCFAGINDAQPGPYPYHIHAAVVPENGNCTAAKAHFDPYERGQQPPCDPTAPQTCEVGDLSGKHGPLAPNHGMHPQCVDYIDPYISLVEGDNAYIGGNMRSIVIHAANSTRIGCANLTLVSGSTPEYPPNNYTVTEPPVPYPTGGAGKLGASGLLLGLVVAAGAMLL